MEAASTYYSKPKRKYFTKAKLWGATAILYLGLSYAGAGCAAKAMSQENESPLEELIVMTSGLVGTVGSVLKMRERLDGD